MRILIVEPFMVESHRAWAEDYARYSGHEVRVLGLQGSHWKWRMHGGAVTMAKRYRELNWKPDLVLATDMMDLALFTSLLRRELTGVKVALYFHENHITYPWSAGDEDKQKGTDRHYGFINYSSALVADKVFFNSQFHKNTFLKSLPEFLKIYPDHRNQFSIAEIEKKSDVLPLGLDLSFIDALREEVQNRPVSKRAVILWNHRWEYDKGPEEFFRALFELQDRGVEFRLKVLGRSFGRKPPIFKEAQSRLSDKIDCFGFEEDRSEYALALLQSDILPVTSVQDFFGISVVEAAYADVFPLVPKRLAYPEHFPDAYHSTFFYKNGRDLVNRLQRLIFDVSVIRKQKTRQFVEHYDWQSAQLKPL